MIPELDALFRATAGRTLAAGMVVVMISVTGRVLGRRLSPGFRSLCWLILPLVLWLPDIRIRWWTEQARDLPGASAPAAAASAIRDLQTWVSTEAAGFHDMVIWIWALGGFLLAGAGICRSLAFWHQVRHERPVTDGPVLDILERCKQEAGVTALVGLVETGLVKGPVLFGFVRPRILLPVGMIREAPDRLKMVLLHELIHLKHQDILVNLVFFCLVCLHWLNPLVWAAAIMAARDREEACDAAVLGMLPRSGHRTYGHVLLGFKGISPTILPNAAGLFETRTKLKRRIEMIISYTPLSLRGKAFALACMIILLAAAAGVSGTLGHDPSAFSQDMVRSLARADYGNVTVHFDGRMARALPEKKLAAVWEAHRAKAGDLQNIRKIRIARETGYEVVYLTCGFAKGPMDLKFVFDDEQRIAGLWFLPVKAGD